MVARFKSQGIFYSFVRGIKFTDMNREDLDEGPDFEADVRTIAEAIWGLEPGGCQPEHYSDNLSIRELDGIIRHRDGTHLIMATISTKLEKAKEDCKKLDVAAKLEARPDGLPTTKWFVTKHQLNAEHIAYAKKSGIICLTLEQFRKRFFDGGSYITKRRNLPFGSARNLRDGSLTIPDDEFVELPMNLDEGISAGKAPLSVGLKEIEGRLAAGRIIIMLAPFGSGKSLSVREIFFDLSKLYRKEKTQRVPVPINLREHWGAEFSDEILERHARSIGFLPRENLTVAWRGGMATLILDGFDEVATQVVATPEKKSFMREARYKALSAARDLISKSPRDVGLLIVGRDHYFDNPQEMLHSLGLTGRNIDVVRLEEFTEDQAETFLKKNGAPTKLPDWLPRKPLILGYLAHRDLLKEILDIDSSQGFGYAWDEFLRLICERESTHERGVMDADSLRRLLERLASLVRTTASGVGPITGRELAEAYMAETGQAASEGVLMQLQRLPGLTPRDQDPTARSFIDADMLAALQGSAVARFILENNPTSPLQGWRYGLPIGGVAVAGHALRKAKATPATVVARIRNLLSTRLTNQDQMIADCVMIALDMAREDGKIDFQDLTLESAVLDSLDLDEIEVKNLELKTCHIGCVSLGPESDKAGILMTECLISKVTGVPSTAGLPAALFNNCEVAEFDDASTNAAVLRLNITPKMKALITILRKLYVQAGAGRQRRALDRGIPPAVVAAVEPVLESLKSGGLIYASKGVVHPIRRQTARVRRILSELTLSKDPIVKEVLKG